MRRLSASSGLVRVNFLPSSCCHFAFVYHLSVFRYLYLFFYFPSFQLLRKVFSCYSLVWERRVVCLHVRKSTFAFCVISHFGSSYCVIVRVRLVRVVGDWRFDKLSGSHLQSQVNSVCQSTLSTPYFLRKNAEWKVRSVENAECRKCGKQKVRSVENEACSLDIDNYPEKKNCAHYQQFTQGR